VNNRFDKEEKKVKNGKVKNPNLEIKGQEKVVVRKDSKD